MQFAFGSASTPPAPRLETRGPNKTQINELEEDYRQFNDDINVCLPTFGSAAGSISTELSYPHHVRLAPDSDRRADVPVRQLRARGSSSS
jgi:hypothetical protein